MPIKVLIPGPLRSFTAGAGEVEVDADSVGGLIQALESRHPGLGERLLDPSSGRLRGYVRVFVNERDVRGRQEAATPLAAGDTVAIVPAIAGGTPG
jgi:molybdopterin converting factor small subunit